MRLGRNYQHQTAKLKAGGGLRRVTEFRMRKVSQALGKAHCFRRIDCPKDLNTRNGHHLANSSRRKSTPPSPLPLPQKECDGKVAKKGLNLMAHGSWSR